MDKQPPEHPFISADLPSLGLTPQNVDQMVREGTVHRVFSAGYVPDGVTDTIEMRAQLASRLLTPGHVITGRTAAWLHGVDTYGWAEGEGMPSIDACARSGAVPSRREGIAAHTRALSRSESPRESWTRLEIHLAGLPSPESQYWIAIDGVPTYRLDLAYPKRRIAVEYDGFDAHERTPEQRTRDRERRKWLRDHGWTVIVIRRGGFTGTGLNRWIGELRRALEPTYTPLRKLERGPLRG